jgi:hypothetical protein
MARRTRSRARMPRNSRASMRTGSSKEASDTIYLRKLHKLLLRRSSTSLRPDQRQGGTARVWIPIPRRTIGPSVRIRRLLRASNKRLASTDFVEETPVVGQGPSGFCRGHGRIPSRRAFCLWDVLKAAAAAPTAAVSARAYRAPRKQRRPDSRCRITRSVACPVHSSGLDRGEHFHKTCRSRSATRVHRRSRHRRLQGSRLMHQYPR